MVSLNHNYYHAWDILGLYRQLFGHVGIPFGKPSPVKTGSGKDYDERYLGETGKPVDAWDETLTGYSQRISDLKGQSFMMPLKFNNWTFPIEPLISVSGSKEVIVTKLPGSSKRPVVEEVAMDSYKVTIKGVFINEDNDDYPFRDTARLSWMLEQRGAVPVVNSLLNRVFGINYLVVTNFTCDAVEGHQSMQWYVIDAIADEPGTLEIKEGAQ